jgi:ATP-binding cassette subfamily B protein
VRRIIILLVVLFIAGSATTGLQFYLMRWAGLHVLNNLRIQIFEHVHRLSLSYYAKNEAGDIMSRITNDTDTLQQALSFVLVQVVRGALMIIWLVFVMFRRSVPFALISMVTVPLMVLATVWFSGQARKAFRRARREIGGVTADLQENIAGVREAQAFTRESENIARFREMNAANRDANIRAVAFTSALAPVLEALGYISIVIVAGIGGILMLRNQELGGTAISLGLIIAFILYTQQFNMPIQMIATLWTNVQSAIAGAERIFDFLDIQPDVTDKPGAAEMPPIEGHVELRDVWMSFQEGSRSCKASAWKPNRARHYIVGPTGAGNHDYQPAAALLRRGSGRGAGGRSRRVMLHGTASAPDRTVCKHVPVQRHGNEQHPLWAHGRHRRRGDQAARLAHADDYPRLPDGTRRSWASAAAASARDSASFFPLRGRRWPILAC